MRVRWTPHAFTSLERIRAYVARDNPVAARELVATIRAKTELLREHPYLGRAGHHPDTRELVVLRKYLVVYRVWSDAIEVVQIWHSAQERNT